MVTFFKPNNFKVLFIYLPFIIYHYYLLYMLFPLLMTFLYSPPCVFLGRRLVILNIFQRLSRRPWSIRF